MSVYEDFTAADTVFVVYTRTGEDFVDVRVSLTAEKAKADFDHQSAIFKDVSVIEYGRSGERSVW